MPFINNAFYTKCLPEKHPEENCNPSKTCILFLIVINMT